MMTDVSQCFQCIDTGVILIQANQCLVLVEIKGYQVRDWIVEKCGTRISQIYSTCVNEGYLMSENVNTLVEKTWQAMKKTL